MNRSTKIDRLIALAIVALLSGPATARAAILYTQPYDGVSPAVPAQIFTDTIQPYSTGVLKHLTTLPSRDQAGSSPARPSMDRSRVIRPRTCP